LKQDGNVYDVSTKSVISALDKPNAVGSTSNFDQKDQKSKTKEELIGIYMKKPYKVMSIKQIKARE
jgi:exosome complex RNA-binding protein Rrp42 (RNase PH superfamily)